ncbi:MAG: PDZ domain-containing protein [Actinomycetota bacterium]|nr:PDZ domain-containing protein [Actinomycetota bacterium]
MSSGRSPADRAGLRPEDLHLGVDGTGVSNVGDLQRLMTGDRIGRPVGVEVFRRGKVQTLEVVPVELPD